VESGTNFGTKFSGSKSSREPLSLRGEVNAVYAAIIAGMTCAWSIPK
jgi:hypothetical protein